MITLAACRLLKAFENLGDDFLGIFVPRVVAGKHSAIGQILGLPAHQRTLLPIAVAAGAEHANQPPGSHFPQGLQGRRPEHRACGQSR